MIFLPAKKTQICDIQVKSIATSTDASILTNIYWDERTSSIYLTDLFGSYLVHYSYTRNKINVLHINGVENPAIFLPIAGSDTQYLISSRDRAFLIGWDGHSSRVVKGREVFRMPTRSFIDQVSVGPHGKLYVGNMGPNTCAEPPVWSLYGYQNHRGLIEYDDHFVSTVGGVVITNTETYYHLDACTKTISAFKWNPITGALCEYQTREILLPSISFNFHLLMNSTQRKSVIY